MVALWVIEGLPEVGVRIPTLFKVGKEWGTHSYSEARKSKALTTRGLLFFVDVNLFVVVCVVSESSTFNRQCPCIDDRLESRDNDSDVRDFYIQHGFDDKH